MCKSLRSRMLRCCRRVQSAQNANGTPRICHHGRAIAIGDGDRFTRCDTSRHGVVQVKWIWLLQVVANGSTAIEASVKNRADTLMNSGVCATSRTRYEGQFASDSAVGDERAEKAASVVTR